MHACIDYLYQSNCESFYAAGRKLCICLKCSFIGIFPRMHSFARFLSIPLPYICNADMPADLDFLILPVFVLCGWKKRKLLSFFYFYFLSPSLCQSPFALRPALWISDLLLLCCSDMKHKNIPHEKERFMRQSHMESEYAFCLNTIAPDERGSFA